MQSSALAHSLSTSVLPARVSIPQPRKRSRSLPRRWLSSRLVPNLLLASTNQNFLPACSGKKLSLPSDASPGNRFGVVAFFFLLPSSIFQTFMQCKSLWRGSFFLFTTSPPLPRSKTALPCPIMAKCKGITTTLPQKSRQTILHLHKYCYLCTRKTIKSSHFCTNLARGVAQSG